MQGDHDSRLGNDVALSRQGNFLAVGMPGFAKVLLYDRDGSNWIQRGPALSGLPGTSFGAEVTVATGRYGEVARG